MLMIDMYAYDREAYIIGSIIIINEICVKEFFKF